MVHYGHSCLIPVDTTSQIKMLYVFVDIKLDSLHFIETLKANLEREDKLSLVSTIQFVATLQAVAKELREAGFSVDIPQVKPLILYFSSQTSVDIPQVKPLIFLR